VTLTYQRRTLQQLLTQIDVTEAVRRRSVQAATTEALAEYWLRRGSAFAQVGTAECDLIAANCRNHARLFAGEYGPVDEPWPGFFADLDQVLVEREVA
jgi:hypothetical protein